VTLGEVEGTYSLRLTRGVHHVHIATPLFAPNIGSNQALVPKNATSRPSHMPRSTFSTLRPWLLHSHFQISTTSLLSDVRLLDSAASPPILCNKFGTVVQIKMSVGSSIDDIITVSQLANDIRRKLIDSPDQLKAIHTE
jgi:hypothetical protein